MRDNIRTLLGRRFDPAELRAIKRLWVRHSLAEDARDIDRLVATITPNGEYEMVPTNQHWYGHDGVRAYYTELFAGFPDNCFEMTEIVVGPQGVFEAARLTATNLGPWAGIPASGLPVDLEVLILFPWDPVARLFTGEKIWFDSSALDLGLGSSAAAARDQD
ncbi:MAG: ester cyclase [Mycobacterium sp.]